MKIELICVGQKMPEWIESGFCDYAKRLPPSCALRLIEIPLKKRHKNVDIVRLQQEEAKQLLAAMSPGAYLIALDEHGISWGSQELAKQLAHWMQNYSCVSLLVGGPEGLATECLQSARQKWSLSPLTLPHGLVRIVVAEQLYRAWSLLNHHPYHRG